MLCAPTIPALSDPVLLYDAWDEVCTVLLRVTSALLFLAAGAFPQTNVGAISGRIVDASGAGVPGAQVKATNPATSLAVETVTDETGLYSFPSLPRATYLLRVEAKGFRVAEETGIVLDAASRRTVDLKLEIGQLAEAVTVSAAAEQVKTTAGDVSKTVNERELSSIAVNGRNYAQLLRLVPGSISTGGDAFSLNLSTTGQRINGIRSNSIYFLMDGADNMDNGGNSNAIVNPNMDAIGEIKILTSSYSAEFGGRSGAMVNVVTKSGTQQFHGTLFEFVRNDVFDARSFFSTAKPVLRFNNFGYTIGGPVYIPGKWNTSRNKLFFFAGQEWKLNRRAEARVSTVPTDLERNGDFNGSSLAAPLDPANNNAPFPNRVIPPSRWSKNGPLLLKPYPLPNFGGPGGNFSVNGTNRTDTREDLVRADYYFNPNHSVMYRWTHDSWDIFDAWQGTNMGFIPGGRPRPGYTTMLTFQDTLSPTAINSFSFSVTKNAIKGAPANDPLKRATLGLTYPEIFPVNQYQVGPNVSIAGFTGYNVGDRIRNGNTTFQWRDDFSKIIGSHTLKFGAQIFRSRKDQNSIVTDNGSVTFNTTARNTTRNVIGDVLLGNFQNYTEGQQDTAYFARFNQFEFYAQDNWRVNRKLTLDYGLRWQIFEPIYSALGNFTTFLPGKYDPAKAPRIDPAAGTLVPGTGDPYNGIYILGEYWPEAARGRIPQAFDPQYDRLFMDLPRGSYPASYGDFGPRFGFAYDPWGDGKSSVRGGFGMFYDLMRTDSLGGTSSNPPFTGSASVFDGNIDAPAGGATRAASPGNLSFTSTAMNQPASYSYNLNVQRELVSQIILDVGYVGTMGRRLTRSWNLNQLPAGTRLAPPNSSINVNALRPYPGYAGLNWQENGDTSHYDSLQVAVSRRIASGLQISANYTWSKTMESSGGGFQDIYNARADAGLSGIHRAHVANIAYVYEIPFFRKHPSKWVRNTVGGWDVSGITSFQSGAPNSVSVPADVALNGSSSSRATVVGHPDLPSGQRTLTRWFNTEAFLGETEMTPGQYGNSGRNVLIGPGQSQWDVALLKNFEITERTAMQFRFESFNLPNHPSFTGINTTVRFDAQGRPSQNYGAVNASNPGRVLSFGLKFLF